MINLETRLLLSGVPLGLYLYGHLNNSDAPWVGAIILLATITFKLGDRALEKVEELPDERNLKMLVDLVRRRGVTTRSKVICMVCLCAASYLLINAGAILSHMVLHIFHARG